MADGGGYRQLQLNIKPGLLIDLFAGGGGASEGLERAFGHPVHIAINHNPLALAVHEVNHPATKHYISDVYEVCPREATQGLPVAHCHASPDCTHHSQALGGQPRDAKCRALTWVVLKWAGRARPDSISIENVSQLKHWGPLIAKRCPETGRVVKVDRTVAAPGERVPLNQQYLVPCPKRKGKTWERFCKLLAAHGYNIDHRVLAACDYGSPTTRERLYVFARRDNRPIIWPAPTHGSPASELVLNGKLLPWRTAAECIDFDRPCHSIFMETADAKKLRIRRPLSDATLRRVAKSVKRFVLEAPVPFIVPLRGTSPSHTSSHSTAMPLSTISAGGTHHGLVIPTLAANDDLRSAHLIKFRGDSKGAPANRPMPVITSGAGAARPAGAAHALGVVQAGLSPAVVRTAHMEQANTGVVGHDVREPVSTLTVSGSQQRLVLTDLEADALNERASMVYRLMRDYLSPKDFAAIQGNVEVDPTDSDRGRVFILHEGQKLVLTDCGLRMLTPPELKLAQGFPPDYVLDYDKDGAKVPQHKQVALIGNSVCPDVLEAIIRANCADLINAYQAAGVRVRPARLSPPCLEEAA